MVVINNNSGLTEAYYSGTSLSEIYVGNHLVWPVNPTPPVVGNKLSYAISGNTYLIPCNSGDALTYIEVLGDIIHHDLSMSGITDIVVGDCVKKIGELCFTGCYSLSSVTISSNVTSIEQSAFKDCLILTNIEIPSGVTRISEFVFDSNYELTTINIPSGVTEIGTEAFFDCLSLLDITIPSGVTSIGDDAFRTSNWTIQDRYRFEKMMHMASARTVTCLATTPPTLGSSSVFSIISGHDVDIATYPIYVPSGSVNAYKTADRWQQYADRIFPIE